QPFAVIDSRSGADGKYPVIFIFLNVTERQSPQLLGVPLRILLRPRMQAALIVAVVIPFRAIGGRGSVGVARLITRDTVKAGAIVVTAAAVRVGVASSRSRGHDDRQDASSRG